MPDGFAKEHKDRTRYRNPCWIITWNGMQKEKSDDGGKVCREEMMAGKGHDDKRKENQRKNSGGDL